jgi:hypothetical protein
MKSVPPGAGHEPLVTRPLVQLRSAPAQVVTQEGGGLSGVQLPELHDAVLPVQLALHADPEAQVYLHQDPEASVALPAGHVPTMPFAGRGTAAANESPVQGAGPVVG